MAIYFITRTLPGKPGQEVLIGQSPFKDNSYWWSAFGFCGELYYFTDRRHAEMIMEKIKNSEGTEGIGWEYTIQHLS